ncbi:MAG: hypothetical protein Q4D96_02805 [Propionibacteriaceae bacterium]|nr:hypothetical protein [Propionibacteriaceae bacterium]
MNPPDNHGRLFELDYPQKVGEYDTYDEAQAAVDFLSDSLFEVENLMIVGTGLRSVERVMGRRTWSRVITQGMFSGLGTGVFVALMFHLFLDRQTNFIVVLSAGLTLGVLFGVLSSTLSYGLSGGRRDFESMRQVVATGYEVLCEHKVAARARELLASRPGTKR